MAEIIGYSFLKVCCVSHTLNITSFRNQRETNENTNGCFPCGKGKCVYCALLSKSQGSTFQSISNKRTFKIRQKINCQSKNVIYLITCKRCNIQGVGHTTNFKKRISNYPHFSSFIFHFYFPFWNYFPFFIFHFLIFHFSFFIFDFPFFISHCSFSIFHFPFLIFNFPFSIFHLPFFIYNFSFSILHFSFSIFHLSFVIFHIIFGCVQYPEKYISKYTYFKQLLQLLFYYFLLFMHGCL